MKYSKNSKEYSKKITVWLMCLVMVLTSIDLSIFAVETEAIGTCRYGHTIKSGIYHDEYNHISKCDVCGKKVLDGHDIVYFDNGDGTHTAECVICGDKKVDKHLGEYGNNNSYYNGKHYFSCWGCSDRIEVPYHQYRSVDSEYHVCDCGDQQKHEFDGPCDEFCNICGEGRFTDFLHDFENGVCSTCGVCYYERNYGCHSYQCDEESEVHACTYCGNIEEHIFSSDCDPVCDIPGCGYHRDTTGKHTFSSDCDKFCNYCRERREVEVNHTYSSDCDSSCDECFAYERKDATNNHRLSNAYDYGYYYEHSGLCIKCDEIVRMPHAVDRDTIVYSDSDFHYGYCIDCENDYAREYHTSQNLVYVDENQHTGICDMCGEEYIVGHSFVTTDNEDGTHTYKCNCGYEYTRNHSCDWDQYDNKNLGNLYHSAYCYDCGKNIKQKHSYEYSMTSHSCTNCDLDEEHIFIGDCDRRCDICGYERDAEAEHNFKNGVCTGCNECAEFYSYGYHNYVKHVGDSHICASCGKTENHQYNSACDEVCNVCDYIREPKVSHLYSSDCDEDCNLCYANRTAMSEHVYSSDCDWSCDKCEKIRDVLHENHELDTDRYIYKYSWGHEGYCKKCGNGFSQSHTMNDAIDSGDGYHIGTCAVCGWEDASGYHNVSSYVNENNNVHKGICDTCGSLVFVDHSFEAVSDNSHKLICKDCGAESKSDHQYGSSTYLNNEYHIYECEICGEEMTGSHYYYQYNYEDLGNGKHGYICENCGEMIENNHYFSNYDENGHYCDSCGLIENHVYYSDCSDRCSVCGASRDVDEGHIWENNVCKKCGICYSEDQYGHHMYYYYDSELGKHICDYCGKAEEHVYSSDCDDNCNICGFRRNGAKPHTYSYSCDRYCDVCDEYRSGFVKHIYDFDCSSVCNVCGYNREPDVDHTYSSNCDKYCDVCDESRSVYYFENHTYSNECDNYCDLCGALRINVGVGHKVVEDVAIEPTCSKPGLTSGTHCSECGEIIIPQEKIVILAHKEVADKAVAATCTTDGKTAGSHCSVCNTVIKAQEVVAATGHKPVEDKAVAATCTTDGKTAGSHCSVCNTVLNGLEIVKATGHKEIVINSEAATCTADGITAGSYCAICNKVLKELEVVKATGHKLVDDKAVAATCTNTGLTAGKHCEVCGFVETEQKVTDKLAHTPVKDNAIAATCIAAGITEGTHCSVCNTILAAPISVKEKGHNFVVDPAVAATCTNTGLTEGKHCVTCGYVETEQKVTDKIAHKEVTVKGVAATCTTDGTTDMKYCSECNSILASQEVVKATGHKEVNDAAVAASCTTDGKTAGSHCSVCNTVLKAQEVVKATGHTYVIDAAVAATCTTDGKTEGIHCSTCKEVLKAQEVVKATGHKEVVDKAVAATTTATGLTEGKHCEVCGTVILKQEIIPVLEEKPVEQPEEKPVAVENPFKDVKNGKYYTDAIIFLNNKGVMTGLNSTTFGFNSLLKREDMVTLLWKNEGKPNMNVKANVFNDIKPGKYYTDAVAWAKKNNIAGGYTSGAKAGSFGKGDTITRQDFVKIIYGYAQYKGYNTKVKSATSYTEKSDASKVSKYARESMNWAYENELVGQGSPLNPKSNIKRQDAAVIIARFLQAFEK